MFSIATTQLCTCSGKSSSHRQGRNAWWESIQIKLELQKQVMDLARGPLFGDPCFRQQTLYIFVHIAPFLIYLQQHLSLFLMAFSSSPGLNLDYTS
jgi:hypothetical protein